MIRPKRLFLLRSSGGGGDGNLFLCVRESKPQNQLIQNANSMSFLPFKGKHQDLYHVLPRHGCSAMPLLQQRVGDLKKKSYKL